jgi:hypothetical protein
MSKQDYIAIARILREQRANFNGELPRGVIEQTAGKLADYFESDNPRFTRETFLSACGVPR